MRNLWPLVVVAALVYAGTKSCNLGPGWDASPGASAPGSHAGGPVRQMERAPTDLMEMGNAMPQGGGGSSRAALDAARAARK